MKLQFTWSQSARAELRSLDRGSAMRVLQALTLLATTGQGDLLPLHGPLAGAMRLRVGPWRVTLRMPKPASVHVLAIEKRGDAYR